LKRLIPLVALLAGCANLDLTLPWERKPQEAAPAPAATSPAAPAPAAAAPAPEPEEAPQFGASHAASIERYKEEVAHAILKANASQAMNGTMPKILKSVVVLRMVIDRHGFPAEVHVMRSNGFKELEAKAVQSVRTASLPKPGSHLMGGYGYVEYTETWLFGGDNKFHIRSVAPVQ